MFIYIETVTIFKVDILIRTNLNYQYKRIYVNMDNFQFVSELFGFGKSGPSNEIIERCFLVTAYDAIIQYKKKHKIESAILAFDNDGKLKYWHKDQFHYTVVEHYIDEAFKHASIHNKDVNLLTASCKSPLGEILMKTLKKHPKLNTERDSGKHIDIKDFSNIGIYTIACVRNKRDAWFGFQTMTKTGKFGPFLATHGYRR